MTTSHKLMMTGDIHAPFGWNVASATARAALVVGARDIGRLAKQADDGSVWELKSVGPAVWGQWLTGAPVTDPTARAAVAEAANSKRIATVRKIRAAAAAAEVFNPVEAQPWLPPMKLEGGTTSTRANSTTYYSGAVVLNAAGTHMFMARVTGATTTAEPAAMTNPLITSTPYGLAPITDGAQTWEWIGAVRTPTALAGAPSVSIGALPSQLTKEWKFAPASAGASAYSWFKWTGGLVATAGLAAYWQAFVRGSTRPSGKGNAQLSGNASLVNFAHCTYKTDAQIIALDLSTGAAAASVGAGTYPTGIEIDGRKLFDGPAMPLVATTAPNGFVIIDMRGMGRRTHTIRISLPHGFRGDSPAFGRIFTDPISRVWAPKNANDYTIAFVGDSIIDGSSSGPLIPGADRCKMIADMLGCTSWFEGGDGGTGFLNTNGANKCTYIQRINDVISAAPDVVWIMGCLNDSDSNGFNSAQRVAAMTLYLQTLRTALPNAIIVMEGCNGGIAIAQNQAMEADQQAAIAAVNDPYTYWIPCSTDTPPWIDGTGTLQSPSTDGNSSLYIGPTDTTHPSQSGILYLAQKDVVAFKSLINGLANT